MVEGPRLKVTGIEELQHALTELPQDVAKTIFKDALWAGGEILARAISSAAPRGATGNLRNSITVRWHSRTGRWFAIAKGAGIQLDVGPEYSHAKKGYAGHLVEYGTRSHLIVAGQKKSGGKSRPTFRKTKTKILADRRMDFGTPGRRGFFGKQIRVSAAPHPFLRPAFETSHRRAIDRIRRVLAQGIDLAWSKIYKKAA